MSLKVQILSLIVSFLYGVFFTITVKFIYQKIINNKKIVNIILSFMFALFHALFYFWILLKINNGIIHIYCILSLLMGFIVVYKIIKKR